MDQANYAMMLEDMVTGRKKYSDLFPEAESETVVAEAAPEEAAAVSPAQGKSLDQEIADVRKSYSSMERPKEDLLSSVIANLGPSIAGMFTGSAGMKAALPATQASQSLYAGMKKENAEQFKDDKERSGKKLEGLLKQKQAESTLLAKNTAKKEDREWQEKRDEKNRQNDLKKAEIIAGGKPPSEGERRAAGYLGMLRQANSQIEKMGGKDGMSYPSLKDPLYTSKMAVISGDTTGSELLENLIKDPAVRSQIQAEIDWAMTTLRDESGAAIGRAEAAKQSHRYFPRAGDTKEVIAQKVAARKQREAAMEVMAGRAKAPEIQESEPTMKSNMTREQKIKLLNQLRGQK